MQHDREFGRQVGERIARFRKAANLTQVELAEAVGLSQQSIASYESGRRRVPLDLLQPLSEILGVSINAILGVERGGPKKPGPVSKLEAQVRRVRELPREKQKWASDLLETVLRNAQHA